MTALAEAFNNGERENVAAHRGGRYGLSSKSSARRAYWRSLMNSAARANHGLRWAFMMTLLTLSLPYRKYPAAWRAKSRRYLRHGKRRPLSARNNIKIIGNSTPWYAQGYFVYDSKSWRAHGIAPARQRKNPRRSAYLIAPGGFCRLPSVQFYR